MAEREKARLQKVSERRRQQRHQRGLQYRCQSDAEWLASRERERVRLLEGRVAEQDARATKLEAMVSALCRQLANSVRSVHAWRLLRSEVLSKAIYEL